MELTISGSTFGYGSVINALVSLLLIGGALSFSVKPVNASMARRKTEPERESVTKECDYRFSSVPAQAIVCAFCIRR